AYRTRTGDDFVVGPLEGLWSSADPGAFTRRTKDDWDWTMLIALPDQVDERDTAAGLAKAALKKPALPAVRVVTLDEGLCLQILHLGSYDAEAETLARLHDDVMPQRGLTFNGRHHEIYLTDPRKTPPERLRTVLRQPVRPATLGGPDGDR
ncbi:MAG TPA: GyrI-like domain-containing protein, partial [Propionibacteriaceae bacterium]|nr:GyrI-like domain-containing protein [Propionibacteriaceae bacterium]